MDNSSPSHVVVYDVNVYLDAARLVGPPFSWERLKTSVHASSGEPFPHDDVRINAARALILVESGRLAGLQKVAVWTSDHIDALVRHKANQPPDPTLRAEDRGLGWEWCHADALLDDLVWHLVNSTNGDTCGRLQIPYESPPLSHEDGLVYATAKLPRNDDLLCERMVVTNDKQFVRACGTKYPKAMTPATFVDYTRRLRRQYGLGRLAGA